MPSPSPVRVLLVDDEEDLRTLIRLSLRRVGGYEVVAECGQGTTAIELAAEHQPEIVLLDLMMPDMDGREALPRIVRVSPRSMVVVLSALEARQEAAPAKAAGAFAYVEKTELGTGLATRLTDLLADFRRALDGETVLAPAALLRVPTTPTEA